MPKEHRIERRKDGRLSAVGIVERVNMDIYNEVIDAPRIFGSSGKLQELATTEPKKRHCEAVFAPDTFTQDEATIFGLVTSLAWLADRYVAQHGHSIDDTPTLDDSWSHALRCIRGLLLYADIEPGRLIREAIVKMLDEMEANERSEPEVKA